eukprot:6472272-Amphidinium_carterae.1
MSASEEGILDMPFEELVEHLEQGRPLPATSARNRSRSPARTAVDETFEQWCVHKLTTMERHLHELQQQQTEWQQQQMEWQQQQTEWQQQQQQHIQQILSAIRHRPPTACVSPGPSTKPSTSTSSVSASPTVDSTLGGTIGQRVPAKEKAK